MTTRTKSEKLLNFADRQLLKEILPWWMENMPDERNGGFFGERDYFNRIQAGKPKGLILNARILWAFSAVYARYGKTEYRVMAERAYTYIRTYFKDPEYPGYFWSLNPDGSVQNGKKQTYAHAFVIYALAEYSAATGSVDALSEAENLFELLESKTLDRQRNGYLEAFSREWGETGDLRLSDIDMNEKKTMNTHLHVIEAYSRLYRLNKNERLKPSILNLLELFRTKIINRETGHLNLFFDENWVLKSGDISYGHDIEASWLLQEAAECIGDQPMTEAFKTISLQICRAVMPALLPEGGLKHESHLDKGKNNNELEWWAQGEAIVGFLNAYRNTSEERFLEIAVGLEDYIEKYFIDRTNGEWHYRIDMNGKAVRSYEKAGFWKCPYHTVRMCLEIKDRLAEREG